MPGEQLLQVGTATPISRWGEPVLHRAGRPVTSFDVELWDLLADVFATNAAAQGAGLAAPQIGVDLAVSVYDCVDAFGRRRRGLVCNPRITLAADPTTDTELEGCPSLPGAHLPVARPDSAVCAGLDQFGPPVRVAGTGTSARCLQRETDHLNGVVVEDHLTPGERRDLCRAHRGVASQYPSSWPS